MQEIQLLSVALGLAALSGINLYLTVFMTGLAVRFDWITLSAQYHQLEVLGHPAILIISGLLFFLEFFADKIPWVDSLWDSLHTLIRPVGATLLAIQVLGESDPAFSVVVAILAGGTALTTHAVKAGARLVVNSSPEPFSNIAVSAGEDALVVGGLWLLHADPVLSFVVLLLGITTALWFAPKLARGVALKLWLIWRKLNGPPSDRKTAGLPSKLPADADILFSRLNKDNLAIEWAVPCHVGRLPGVPMGVGGFLVMARSTEPAVFFVAPRRFGAVSMVLDLRGWKVTHEPAFLTEDLVLYNVKTRKKVLFLFDRPRVETARQVAADLEERIGPVAETKPAAALETASAS